MRVGRTRRYTRALLGSRFSASDPADRFAIVFDGAGRVVGSAERIRIHGNTRWIAETNAGDWLGSAGTIHELRSLLAGS